MDAEQPQAFRPCPFCGGTVLAAVWVSRAVDWPRWQRVSMARLLSPVTGDTHHCPMTHGEVATS